MSNEPDVPDRSSDEPFAPAFPAATGDAVEATTRENDRRDGHGAATETTATAGGDRLRWATYAGGPLAATPLHRDGVLYVGTELGAARVDGTSGRAERVDGPDGPVHPAGVRGRQLVAATPDGDVLAVDLDADEVAWRRPIGADLDAAPVVVDDEVWVVTRDGRLVAFEAGDGARLGTAWSGQRWCSGLVPAGDVALVASVGGGLYARDPRSGTELWRHRPHVAVAAPPTVRDGVAFVGTVDDDRAYALDATTGEELWRVDVDGPVWGRIAADGDCAVVADGSGAARGIDARTGAVRWRSAVGAPVRGGPALGADAAFLGTAGGRIVALDRDDGGRRFAVSTASRIVGSPVATDGGVYAGNRNGWVYALDAGRSD